MELKAIEELLEKYLQAETSREEEARLTAYFSSGNVAPHLQEYAAMFAYFSASRAESYGGKALKQLEDHNPMVGRKKVYSWVAVAASIVIMAGVFLQENNGTSEFGSYEDPEVAMQKTKEALNMVSQLMHFGKDDLRHLKEFDVAKNKILK